MGTKRIGVRSLRAVRETLDELGENGVLDRESVLRARSYLEERYPSGARGASVSGFLALLASIFMIGGIILLVGYNWNELGKPVKTVLVLLPTLVSTAVAFTAVFFRKDRFDRVKREPLAFFWAVAFGGAVAGIAQIYNIPEDRVAFLTVWCVSTLGIHYLLSSLSVVPVYIALSIALVSVMQLEGSVGTAFAPLLLALVPQYLRTARTESRERAAAYRWFLIAGAVAGLGVSLEKNLPGTWLVAYSALFSVLYLVSVVAEDRADGESLFASPMLVSGMLGISLLSLLFSWEWPWLDIGWRYYRVEERFVETASVYDYLVIVFGLAASIALAVTAFFRKRPFSLPAAGFGWFVFLLYLYGAATGSSIVPVAAMNLFILALSITGFAAGVRSESLRTMNASMLLLSAAIVARFFDAEMSLLLRGIAFLLCGLGFLLANRFLARRFAGKGA